MMMIGKGMPIAQSRTERMSLSIFIGKITPLQGSSSEYRFSSREAFAVRLSGQLGEGRD